jgi:hypothetical protein
VRRLSFDALSRSALPFVFFLDPDAGAVARPLELS